VSALAELEIALRQDCAYARLADSLAHRAVREDSLTLTKGRDAITTLRVNQGKQRVGIDHDLDDMIAYTVDGKWQGHLWVWREDGRILREVVIENSGVMPTASAVHPPLGELRAGVGQFAAGAEAILPPGFPADARDLANTLHQAWNGRAFNIYSAEWLTDLVAMMPDSTFQFEHAIVADGQTALLWRVMGHHASGQRIRLIGSTIVSRHEHVTVIDQAALKAQIGQPLIQY
jgi:hypothetical protein